jgi:hypothetical protein
VPRRRIKTRWGWLVVSVALMALAVFFLYPTVQSLTESESPVAAAPAIPAPEPKPAPIRAVELPLAQPIRTVARTMVPPKPIREVAPMAADSIRTRIDDEIPVYVTMRIGANGSVVGAQAATAGDGIQAYLVQRSLEAVRQWKFRPARLGPDPVPSKWTVRFRFDKAGVDWN